MQPQRALCGVSWQRAPHAQTSVGLAPQMEAELCRARVIRNPKLLTNGSKEELLTLTTRHDLPKSCYTSDSCSEPEADSLITSRHHALLLGWIRWLTFLTRTSLGGSKSVVLLSIFATAFQGTCLDDDDHPPKYTRMYVYTRQSPGSDGLVDFLAAIIAATLVTLRIE